MPPRRRRVATRKTPRGAAWAPPGRHPRNPRPPHVAFWYRLPGRSYPRTILLLEEPPTAFAAVAGGDLSAKRGVVLMRNRRLNDAFFCFFRCCSMRCCSSNAFLCTVSPDIFVLLCRRGTCAAGTAIGRVFHFGLTVFFERSLGISLSLRGDAKPLFLHASRIEPDGIRCSFRDGYSDDRKKIQRCC